MFCNFCGVSVPQGEAYCSKCAPKARSNRSREEKMAELGEIKTEVRGKKKLSTVQREVGQKELIKLFVVIIVAFVLTHWTWFSLIGQGHGGEALIELGVLGLIVHLISRRSIAGRNLLVIRNLVLAMVLFAYAFMNLLDHVLPFSLFFLAGLLNFVCAVALIALPPIKEYFFFEE